MLNPSIAGEEQDDPNLGKCLEFAKGGGSGYGSKLFNLWD
jgi:hypothetical protein